MAKKETEENDVIDTEGEDRDSVDDVDAGQDAAADDDVRSSEPDLDGDDDAEEEADASAEGGSTDLTATEDSEVPTHLGAAQKYVHAAFFGAGILVAYLSAKILAAAWNELAEWPAAIRAVPALLRFAEDDRANYTLVAGALIGVISVIQTYRKAKIRQWADDVASELANVTWPTKDTVTNGTVVVVIATVIATTYIGLLDRVWGFLTNLVYGA
ncbi:MAG: preprotein translocase subunit SecE [Polyangiaceae bacterium]